MEIQIDPHTLKRAEERGASSDEILDVILTGVPLPAKYSRLGKAKTFDFMNHRNNRFYEQKRVEVYYVPEDNKMVTVTVYVFYGKWEK